ncbi:MAG: NADH-quinone oxidoreductase subunit NuoK [Candidatus Eisenbacteria bacterium]
MPTSCSRRQLFAMGIYGVLTRKNLIAILPSVELMANAVNLNFVAFARFAHALLGRRSRCSECAHGGEVGVGLAIVILVYRQWASVEANDASTMQG